VLGAPVVVAPWACTRRVHGPAGLLCAGLWRMTSIVVTLLVTSSAEQPPRDGLEQSGFQGSDG